MPSKDFILWFDLETTGNQSTDRIIEFGAILTDAKLNVISDYTATFQPSFIDLLKLDPAVIEMHTASGLWRDLIEGPSFTDYVHMEQDILRWLDDNTNKETQHIPVAGSGISHFDRKYLAQYLPGLNSRLTYWNYDFGVVRRFMELAGVPLDIALVEAKTHRALDDVKAHLEEAQVWINLVQGWEMIARNS